MAASKPISWANWKNTTLISLNNNLGTLLTLVLGCFPLDIQPYRTMSDDSILIITLSRQILTDKIFTIPQCPQITYFIYALCMRLEFCTCYDVI